MLGKLIKYDIKSTWRDFTGIYLAIILGVILIPLIFNNINNGIIQLAAGFIAFGICIAVIVVTVISLFKIFNVNVFSREGYLTMTLPVNATQIVTSKLLVSTMWILLTGIVSCIGIFLFMIVASPDILSKMHFDLSELFKVIGGKGALTILVVLLSIITGSVKEIAKLFLACSIAHLKQLNRFRVPVGIISYFVFSWIETFIIEMVSLVLPEGLQKWLSQLSVTNDISSAMNVFNGAMGVAILYGILLTVAFASATIWILNHKLELE